MVCKILIGTSTIPHNSPILFYSPICPCKLNSLSVYGRNQLRNYSSNLHEISKTEIQRIQYVTESREIHRFSLQYKDKGNSE